MLITWLSEYRIPEAFTGDDRVAVHVQRRVLVQISCGINDFEFVFADQKRYAESATFLTRYCDISRTPLNAFNRRISQIPQSDK